MANRKLNKPETCQCIPYEKMNRFQKLCHDEGVSGIMGLWHKKALEREANREQLVTAGFLLPRKPSKPPKPLEQISFAEWENRQKSG